MSHALKVMMLAVLLLILLALGVVAAGLAANRVPLTAPPGLAARLNTYLTTHVAETRRDHPFPELQTRCYPLTPEALLERVTQAVTALGWETREVDKQAHRLHAVVTTALWRFQDDVWVSLTPGPICTELKVRSSSRVGRGDLGANTRHILDLLARLDS